MAEKEIVVDEGNADKNGEPQVDVEKLTADITNQVSEQFKNKIAALDRRINELSQEKKTLAEKLDEKEQEGKTVEQQIAEIKKQYEQDKKAAQLRERNLQLAAEAAKLGVSEKVAQAIDKELPFDDAMEVLKDLSAQNEQAIKAKVNESISSQSYKPGAEGGESQSNGKANIEALKKLDFKTMGQMSDAELAALDGSAS